MLYNTKHKVFISYHHKEDQYAVAKFIDTFDRYHDIFTSRALGTELGNDIINSNNPDYVMCRIRELYLEDSTVTIVLIGKYTWSRRYVDWEIQASLRSGETNTPNGLIGIVLPITPTVTPKPKIRLTPPTFLTPKPPVRIALPSFLAQKKSEPLMVPTFPFIPQKAIEPLSFAGLFTPRSPERLRKNLILENKQKGYARLYKYPQTPVQLEYIIQEAFESRVTRTHLIVNSRDRFLNNKPIP